MATTSRMPASPSPSTTRFVFRLLVSAMKRYRRRGLLALALVVVAKLLAVAVPLALKAIIDALGTTAASVALVMGLVLGYAALRFLVSFFSEVRDVIFVRVTQTTVSGFLLQVFEHLHRLGAGFHARRRTGGVSRDVERGTAGIGFLLGVALFTIFPTVVEIGAVVAIMSANYSGWFTLAIVATFLVYAAFTVIFTERRAIYQRALNELDSSANGRLVDSLLNHEAVKAYTNERFERDRFQGILGEWVEVGVKNQTALSLLHVGQSAIIALGVASVMLLAVRNAVAGTMSVGDVVLVNAYVIQICLPLNSLGFVFRQARDAVVNAEKMLRLLDQKPEIDESPAAPDLQVNEGGVRFEHVSFGYDPSRQILWDVDFTIPARGTTALVGGSGSGKSTVARLLYRFYDVGSGRITIDGVDVRGVSQRSLRAAIGVVPQDTTLFNDTIAYNIAYGRPEARFDEVVEAARAAHVHEFIAALPEGYDTQVGERGVMLSGGEKQRIAIARAILRNPLVIVFDEATSALDMRAERAIQAELDRLSQDRTTLIIAHRLATVVNADEILVLEHGRVVERGSHEQLLRLDRLYAQLWRLQRQQREVELVEREMATQAVNLFAVLATVIDGLRAEIDGRGVGVYSAMTAPSPLVSGDPSRLQQVMWTLARNAVCASPAGGRVEWRIERDGSSLRVIFRSTGDPGRSAHTEDALEMSEVRAIVEQHGGRLETLATTGEGREQRLSLPLLAAAPASTLAGGGSAPPALIASMPAAAITGACVLVIDAANQARARIEAVLHREGAMSRAYSSSSEALEWLFSLPRDEWPDVLVCDVALEEEDGYDVVQTLRRFEDAHAFALPERLPAVALTGASDRSDQGMHALLAGFQAGVRKPVAADELIAALSRVLHRTGRQDDDVQGNTG